MLSRGVFPPVQPVRLFHTDMSVYITNTFKWSPAAAVPQFAGKHRALCTRWTACAQFGVENISSAIFSARAIRAAAVTLLWGGRDGNYSQGLFFFFLGGGKKNSRTLLWTVWTGLASCGFRRIQKSIGYILYIYFFKSITPPKWFIDLTEIY